MGKYSNILKERLIIALKENFEYKANFILLLINDFFGLLVFLLFFSVYDQFLSLVLDWDFRDFLIYYFLIMAGRSVIFVFSLLGFRSFYLSGGLNSFLSRPVNCYFICNMNKTKGHNLLFLIIYFLLIIFLGFNYENLFIGILFYIFGLAYFIIFWNFLRSLIFYMKDTLLLQKSVWEVNDVVRTYTPAIFRNQNFSFIGFLLPSSIYGFFVMTIFKGDFTYINSYFFLVILTFFLLVLGNYLLWRYGLRRYEAFG